jgi:hypothetical protein
VCVIPFILNYHSRDKIIKRKNICIKGYHAEVHWRGLKVFVAVVVVVVLVGVDA